MSVVHCPVRWPRRWFATSASPWSPSPAAREVGWHIKSIAGRKKVALELGGNGAVIVAPDADLGFAAARCVRGGVVYGGQYCIGVQRILVIGRLRRSSATRCFATGLPPAGSAIRWRPDIDVGPVIDARSADRIEDWIGRAGLEARRSLRAARGRAT